jgi:hypothetical protein
MVNRWISRIVLGLGIATSLCAVITVPSPGAVSASVTPNIRGCRSGNCGWGTGWCSFIDNGGAGYCACNGVGTYDCAGGGE